MHGSYIKNVVIVTCETGLIAAACGQLDSLLLQGYENKKIIPMAAGTIDTPATIIYQNGTATKASNGTLEGIFSICNGVH